MRDRQQKIRRIIAMLHKMSDEEIDDLMWRMERRR